jgi:hypothetical protein
MFKNFGKIQDILDLIFKIMSVVGVVHSTVQHVVDQFKPVAPVVDPNAPAAAPAPAAPAPMTPAAAGAVIATALALSPQ